MLNAQPKSETSIRLVKYLADWGTKKELVYTMFRTGSSLLRKIVVVDCIELRNYNIVTAVTTLLYFTTLSDR